jgi:hypothetical protein
MAHGHLAYDIRSAFFSVPSVSVANRILPPSTNMPWQKRTVFGTVRYMNAAGFRRKFDMDACGQHVAKIDQGTWDKA